MMCGFLFKQKTAYEWRISDWSSDVCSSDLQVTEQAGTDARVEDEGQLADRRLAGGEAFDRTGAGARADGLSAFEVGPVMRAVPGIVALHASAFAGDPAPRQAVAARSIATGEAAAGGGGDTGTAMARGAASAGGDASAPAPRLLAPPPGRPPRSTA